MLIGGLANLGNGPGSAFLARYNAAGTRLWGRQVDELPYAITSDGAGGCFVAGTTSPAPFDFNAFLARHDGAGNRLWIRSLATNDYDYAAGVAPDGAGGVYITGYTLADLGGPNAFPSTYDVWLARYDAAGNRAWIRQFGAMLDDYAYCAAPDGSGGVYIAGATGGIPNPSQGESDAFLVRYNGTGIQVWLRQFGTPHPDEARGVAADGAGGVYVAGTSEEWDGGNHLDSDIFLYRFSAAGAQVWTRQLATAAHEWARCAAPDGFGGVLIGGRAPSWGGIVAQYDSAGTRAWIKPFGNAGSDARGVCGDGAGGAFATGPVDGVPAPNAFVARLGATDRVVGVTASDGTCGYVRVAWSPASAAADYAIWRGPNANGGGAVRIAIAPGSPYFDATVPAGTPQWYFVQGRNAQGAAGPISEPDSGFRVAAAAPTGVAASDGTQCDYVRVSWDPVAGASSYVIYRSATSNSTEAVQVGTDSASPFFDAPANRAGYYYFVKAVTSCGASPFSAADLGHRAANPTPPSGVVASDGTNPLYVRVAWQAVNGASGYSVWRAPANNTSQAVELGPDNASPYWDTPPAGQTFWYFVRTRTACGLGGFSVGDSGRR